MIYSGNLNDYRRAFNRIKALGFSIDVQTWRSSQFKTVGCSVAIHTGPGEWFKSPCFEHWDEDVQTNMLTEWLNKQADALESWK